MTGSITPSGNIQWNLFRRGASGKLRACAFVIDKKTSVILAEKCEPDTDEMLPKPSSGATSGPIAHLEKFGIPYKVRTGGDGRPVLEVQPHNAPKRTKRITRFFDMSTPCDFPQCEELRRRWLEDREKLGPDCTACSEGSLQRQYMDLLNDILPP